MANSEGGKSRKRNFTTLLLVGIKREGGKEPCMLLAKGGRKRTWLKVAFFRLLFFAN